MGLIPKINHNWSSKCKGKQKHKTPGKAEAQIRSLARTSTDKFESYWCNFCKHWHVGHAVPTQWEEKNVKINSRK